MGIAGVRADSAGAMAEDRRNHRILPGLDAEEEIGWEEIGRVLEGKPALRRFCLNKD